MDGKSSENLLKTKAISAATDMLVLPAGRALFAGQRCVMNELEKGSRAAARQHQWWRPRQRAAKIRSSRSRANSPRRWPSLGIPTWQRRTRRRQTSRMLRL